MGIPWVEKETEFCRKRGKIKGGEDRLKCKNWARNGQAGTSPGGPIVKTSPSNTEGGVLILGQWS